jgi:uncharacterized membrane protein
MSVSANNTLAYVTKQIWLYGSFSLLIPGLIGNSINILMFRTKLKANPCSIYLLTGDIANTLILLSNLVPIIVDLLNGTNGSTIFPVLCKLWTYAPAVFTTISILMLCLASVDRYCSTSRDVRRRQWSAVRVARISILIAVTVSFLFPIPDLFYAVIHNGRCYYISENYDKYVTYFMVPVLLTILPLCLLSIFGCLTRKNLKHCLAKAHQTEAQRLNYQLTYMLLMQIIWFIISTLTLTGVNLYDTIKANHRNHGRIGSVKGLIEPIAFMIYSSYQCGNFYVYYLISATYRNGVNKIFKKIYRQLLRR